MVNLRRTKFHAVATRPVDRAHVRPVEPNDWREQRFQERETARLAARNEQEAVDNRLRAGVMPDQEEWSLEDGWLQQRRTIIGTIRDWLSRKRR